MLSNKSNFRVPILSVLTPEQPVSIEPSFGAGGA
jgi:hypothetical protein